MSSTYANPFIPERAMNLTSQFFVKIGERMLNSGSSKMLKCCQQT